MTGVALLNCPCPRTTGELFGYIFMNVTQGSCQSNPGLLTTRQIMLNVNVNPPSQSHRFSILDFSDTIGFEQTFYNTVIDLLH